MSEDRMEDRKDDEKGGRPRRRRVNPLRDPAVVIESLVGALPTGKRVFYQKHMAHHLLAEIDGQWLSGLTHAFLIRHPLELQQDVQEILHRELEAHFNRPSEQPPGSKFSTNH